MRIRRRYHFRWPGLLYVLITMLIGVGAFNSQNNLLFLLFGIGASGLLVSGVVSGAMMMNVRVRRIVEGPASVGGVVRIRYEVRNTGRVFPLMGLIVEEVAPRGPGGGWGRGVSSVRAFAAHVPAGGSVVIEATPTALGRGRYVFEEIAASTRFPLGVVEKSCRFDQHSGIVIWPRVHALRTEALSWSMSREAPTESEAAQRRGDDFYGLRDYVPGDSPRMVAWRASARTGELVVRETASPIARRLWVELELAAADGSAETDVLNERAIELAASLLALGDRAGMDAGLTVPGHAIDLPPSGGGHHLSRMLDALGALDVGRTWEVDDRAGRGRIGRLDTHLLVRAAAGMGAGGASGKAGGRRVELRPADLDRLVRRRSTDGRDARAGGVEERRGASGGTAGGAAA